MCRSKQQGGQRCHAHAAAAVHRAATAHGIAPLDLPTAGGDRQATAHYRDALIDYATTAKGAANLWAVVGTYPDGHPSRRDLEKVFYKAVKLRQQREDTYTEYLREHGHTGGGRDMLDDQQWAVTTGERCPRCGQYVSQAAAHTCPARLTMLPATAPARFSARADGPGDTELPLVDDLPGMDVGTARAILTDLDEHGDHPDRLDDLAEAIAVDNDFASDYGDRDLCSPTAAALVAQAANTELDDELFRARDGGVYLNSERFDRLQSHLKADTVAGLGGRIHQIDPAISPDRATEIADRALHTWAMNYSYDEYGERSLAPYQQAARTLADGGNPLAGHQLDSPDYEAGIAVVAQYQATQQWFADRGITSVQLHRGVAFYDSDFELEDLDRTVAPDPARADGEYRWVPSWVPAEQLDDDDSPALVHRVDSKPLASWSDSDAVAGMFAEDSERSIGYIVSTTMPVERILSVPRTGNGCLVEREVVVLDGPGTYTVRPAY